MSDDATTVEAPKLFAGKYKTVEDLENGYKNAEKMIGELNKVKGDFESYKSIPADYQKPSSISISDSDVAGIKDIAKIAGLNQDQFNGILKGYEATQKAQREVFEKSKRDIGDETLNVLEDYITKNNPKPIADRMMRELIADKALRDVALEDRQRRLNTAVPGSERLNYNYTTTHEDVLKAREKVEKTPTVANRDAYIRSLESYAKSKKALQSV